MIETVLNFITGNSDLLLTALVVLLGMWKINWKTISAFLYKLSTGIDKVTPALHTVSSFMKTMGMDKASTIVQAATEVVEAGDDLIEYLASATSDGNFTKDEIKKAIEKGKIVVIEGDEFLISVTPKKK